MQISKVIKDLKTSLRKKRLPSYGVFQEHMRRYQTDKLAGIGAEEFKKEIDRFTGMADSKMEGFADPSKQRDLSIQFHWGHDHDFGSFAMQGRMADRHLQLLAIFKDEFKALSGDLSGLRVLDIGCWTGGTSLLLCAMGAEVLAIEEVKKYTDCLSYLKKAFNVRNLEVRNLSLYECSGAEFQDAFDIVLFAGVLYHISDPVLALRIAFNATKDNGICLLETMAANHGKPLMDYWGPNVFTYGERAKMNRGGWNWMVPSPLAVKHMMTDVGYESVEVKTKSDRAFAVGKRTKHVDIMRAGLSVRDIR